jgi:hypothetical protein
MGLPRLETYRLICHPASPASQVTGVTVEARMDDEDEVLLTFIVDGLPHVRIPAPQSPGRADDLWKSTCFELFLRPENEPGYIELNFSPSGQWAAYAFDDYREGMRDCPLPIAPHIERDGEGRGWEIDVDLSPVRPGAMLMGLSAVVEELDGTRSYWALAHPPEKPDFHHPACFARRLPAARGP